MNKYLTVQNFLSFSPPKDSIEFGNFRLTTGMGGRVVKTSGYERRPTVVLEQNGATQDEISNWVLFHSFLLNEPMTLKTYMNTLNGELKLEKTPFGNEKDYTDIADAVYFPAKTGVHLEYCKLYDAFQKANTHQMDMVKNYLIEITPGQSYSYGDLVNYSYWKLVIYFSIIEGLLEQQEYCPEVHNCTACGKKAEHYPVDARAWMRSKLFKVIGSDERTDEYLDLIWAVRQRVRHKTAHASAHPTARYMPVEVGETHYDTSKAVKGFESDNHALEALVYKMKDVARVLLLDDILDTDVFPDIKTFSVRRL